LEQRIPAEMRTRAQALLTLMMSGFGNLAGSLGFGWWRLYCQNESGSTDWPLFWTGLTVVTCGVFTFFAIAYRGSGRGVLTTPAAELAAPPPGVEILPQPKDS
jgi:TRAP-type C4-dicarboxylate transport system permease small subunit